MKPEKHFAYLIFTSLVAIAMGLALTSARSAHTPSRGTLTTSTYTYEGGVTNGKQNGFGIIRYTNGNTYTGFWDMAYKHGLGRIEYADGTMDFGRWRRGSLDIPQGRNFTPGRRVIGIDVSKYQGTIDWKRLSIPANASGKATRHGSYLQPVLFVIVKSTQGTNIRNAFFSSQFDGAGNHGIVRGAYHFLSPSSSGKAQARYFINHTPLTAGDLPPVLDFEVKQSIMRREHARIIRIVKDWLNTVEEHYGVKPIIYTNDNYYRRYLRGHGFDDYDFWIANYNGSHEHPDCKFWQFTETGKVLGINHDTDLNVFEGGDWTAFKEYVRLKGIR